MRRSSRRFGVSVLGKIVCSVLISSGAAAAHGHPRSRPYLGYVTASLAPNTAQDVRAIWESGAIVLGPHDPSLVRHQVAAPPALLERLRAQGIAFAVENTDFQAQVDASYDKWARSVPAVSSATMLPVFFNQVQDLAPIFAFLDDQVSISKGRAKVSVLGKAWQGNEVKVVRIASAADDGDRATIFVTATHHAYEWLVPMIGSGLVWALVNEYDSDPNVKKIVDNLNVYIIPVLNPDSYVKTHSGDRMRRTNQSPSCAGGVDLNRNWPSVGWGHGVGACGSQFYPGPQALSEPETQLAKGLADGLKKLVWYIDYHTQSAQVMIPYAWTTTKPAGYAKAKDIATQYGQIIGLAAHDGYDLGQGSGGGALDYFQEILDAKGGTSHVVEERGQNYDPPSDGVPPYVDKNITAFVAIAAKIADENPAMGGGSSGAGGSGGGGAGGAGGGGGTGGGAGGAIGGSAGSGSAGASSGAGGAATGGSAGIGGGGNGGGGGSGRAGAPTDAGAGGSASTGAAGTRGGGSVIGQPSSEGSGCGCRVGEGPADRSALAMLVAAGFAAFRRRSISGDARGACAKARARRRSPAA